MRSSAWWQRGPLKQPTAVLAPGQCGAQAPPPPLARINPVSPHCLIAVQVPAEPDGRGTAEKGAGQARCRPPVSLPASCLRHSQARRRRADQRQRHRADRQRRRRRAGRRPARVQAAAGHPVAAADGRAPGGGRRQGRRGAGRAGEAAAAGCSACAARRRRRRPARCSSCAVRGAPEPALAPRPNPRSAASLRPRRCAPGPAASGTSWWTPGPSWCRWRGWAWAGGAGALRARPASRLDPRAARSTGRQQPAPASRASPLLHSPPLHAAAL